ncbi:hypothetical protein JCM24511_09644 [Saitozyma sp. JCM 24511]|nr:hypothetical protein JCM24511_09644 [Saitozyma sp. JCM 24511]
MSPPAQTNGNSAQGMNHDVHHLSFLPPCEHGKDGDTHAHAFDLLSLSSASPAPTRPSLPQSHSTSMAVPSSVPTHTSYLSATRPVNGHAPGVTPAAASGSGPKPRRMSSSTAGALGRGKLGLTGEMGLGIKDARPPAVTFGSSYSGSTPIPNRRPVPAAATGTSPTPQLFDFAKTDRRPSQSASTTRPARSSVIPASLPTRSILHSHKLRPPTPEDEDDMELDMAFDGDEDDYEEGARSGSAEVDMEDDEEGEGKEDWRKLALGTGSGGVKGRRKGMVFKCENCGKEYRHPSCLVKHRWEHSPHWKEPTQLSMSKHQQVQMLEASQYAAAAAILAHLDPTGRSLPTDKSLWPMMLSPPGGEGPPRRLSRDHSGLRSPPSSTIAPLTPSSLREPSSLGTASERASKERKSSPGSDSTTSSMGAGEPYIPAQPTSGLGLRNGTNGASGANGATSIRRTSISPFVNGNGANGSAPGHSPRLNGSFSSSVPGPGTPHSLGASSLPRQMAELKFGPSAAGSSPGMTGAGVSPIPRIGNGMFGQIINTAVPSSSVRSGVEDLPEEEEDEEEDDWRSRGVRGNGKSSSEEYEERRKDEEYGMAMEMEL